MADMNKLLGQLLGSGAAGGFAGGLAGGLTSSMLTSKSGRKIGTKALKMGGIAAVGALAYAAYQRYSTGKGTAPDALPETAETALSQPPEGSAFLPPKNDPAGSGNAGTDSGSRNDCRSASGRPARCPGKSGYFSTD